MPRFVQFPQGYEINPSDTDDGLDCVRAIAAGLCINVTGAALAILLWFLWGAA